MSCLLFSNSSVKQRSTCCHPASIKLRNGMYLFNVPYLLTNYFVVGGFIQSLLLFELFCFTFYQKVVVFSVFQ